MARTIPSSSNPSRATVRHNLLAPRAAIASGLTNLNRPVLMHIISQLRPGADLSRVVLPTFILEPRSMLERITKYELAKMLSSFRPDTDWLPIASCATPSFSSLFPTSTTPSSDLCPWSSFTSADGTFARRTSSIPLLPKRGRPLTLGRGVKKPLNPILGEVFTCYWEFPDKTKAYYIAEQTSHHPPKSSYFYMVPEHHIRVDGTLKPRSKFLGNSAASMMEGTAVLTFLNRGKDPAKGER